MQAIQTSYSVADYCQGMERKDIVVNPQYQRSDRVWPPAARSFLIETMLLGFPTPKLSLYQVTDVKSKKSLREIVDGQQRSRAIFDYYNDNYRLSNTLETKEVKGKRFSDLDEEFQRRFLEYAISADLFVAAVPDDIREMFRRINSYNVPLNPEEQRHARFQGDFKWFIYRLSRRYDNTFVNVGMFSEKQLIRLGDAKLLSEICHALLYGISTTSKSKLDRMYRDHEKQFPQQEDIESRLHRAISLLISFTEIHQGPLMRPYVVYALMLAITHMQEPVAPLIEVYPRNGGAYKIKRDVVLANLSRLAEALEDPDNNADLKAFIDASSGRTNVASQRETRFRWLCKALEPELL